MSKRRPPAKQQHPDEHVPVSREGQDEDAFIARVLHLSIWAKENTQTLVIAIATIVLLLAGTVYYMNFRTAASTQATMEFEQIQQMAAIGESEGAKAELVGFLDRYGDTRQAAEARILLGELHLESGNAPEAIRALQPAASGSLRNNPLGIQAATLLGAAYEEAGQLQDAEQAYLRVADRALLNFQVQEALNSAAQVRIQRGDYAGAAELYRDILSGLEQDDAARGFYQMRLAEVTARR